MEIEGRIIYDLPLQSGTSKAGNPWKKKEWVLETFGQYPRKICFNFFNDKVDNNPLEVGKDYTIGVDIESREFNGRWYTDVRGFSSRPYVPQQAGGYAPAGGYPQQPAAPAYPQQPAAPAYPEQPAAPTFTAPAAEEGDELPF